MNRILGKAGKRIRRLTKIPLRKLKQFLPFKSQKNQDLWVIFKALPFRRGGYFLELAAADGITHSNTYALEKIFGWKGICVEPNPYFFESLQKRRQCITDNSVVSDSEEAIEFRIDNEQLGGIVAADTDNNELTRGDQLADAEIISYKAIRLETLLERHNAPPVIDYLSLDVEGSEERVLRNFDYGKYKFRCITIERPTPELNNVLFDNDYVFVKNHRDDTFYVHSSLLETRHIKCLPFEQVPPKNW